MKFGIVADKYKDKNFAVLKQTVSLLNKLGAEAVLPMTVDRLDDYSLGDNQTSWEGVDLAISIGGDGTFLYTCHEVYERQIPLIGINLGQMGFMTEIEYEELEQSLSRLVKGDYEIQERMMLEVELLNVKNNVVLHSYALNDVVLYRGNISRIIPFTLSLNGTLIETIPSDGVIVAGPTGSTGYALACGGPIIQPQLDMMLFTPISPHTLHNRSYIVAPDSRVEIGIAEAYPFRPFLSIDGRSTVDLGTDDRVRIHRASEPMRLASLNNYEFFRRVPDKINARGMAR